MDVFVQEMLQRQRRQSIVLFLVTAVALLSVAGMVYYWVTHNKQNRYTQNAAKSEVDTARTAAVPFTEPLPLYLIDPLKQIQVVDVPDKPAPLTVDWVKQAVYHLLEGEKAAQDGRYDVALEELRKARKIFPELKGLSRMVGLIHLAQKDYPEASKAFEQALQEETASFGVINNLAIAYIGMNDMPRAEARLLDLIKLQSNYAFAYFNLATVRQRQNDLPKAAEYLGIYTRMRPGDHTAGENYALMLIQLGQWEKAAATLDELGDAMPAAAVIQFRLAQALSHVTGKRNQALDTLEHAVSLVDSRKALAWLARSDFDLLRSEDRFKKLSDQLATKGSQ
jgi:tetratricopeptide (TPR) repeat protein